MPVLHDYECKAHGVFEAMAPKCPHGCSKSFVQRVFLKAPGFKSERTGRADRIVRDLAASHGMTNIGNRGGQSASQYVGGAARSRGNGNFQFTDKGSAWMGMDHSQPFNAAALGAGSGGSVDVKGFNFSKPTPQFVGRDTNRS